MALSMSTTRRFLALLLLVSAVVLGIATTALADNPKGRDNSNRPELATDLYFVAFRDGLTVDNTAFLQALGARTERRFPALRTASVRMSAAILARLQGNSRVEYVEPVPMRYKSDLSTSQLVPTASNGLYGLVRTHAIEAQAAGATGLNVNVGVADTGIDYTHPDIAPNYKGGIDIHDNDNDPWWNFEPEELHATHVSGIILGANNTQGVFGVAYNANLYNARVLGPTGGSAADVMAGVQWLVETAHCRVINMSLGGGFRTRTEQTFYTAMHNQGVVLVAASGNDGSNRVNYPAGYDGVIAVGAVDKNNVKADFSNSGLLKLDLVAPGVAVLSSVPIGTGSEASVTAGSNTFLAFGMEFAGKTTGLTNTIVSCGMALASTDCPVTTPGKIALIQRGTNGFAEKVQNAMNAGAAGAIIYNNVAGDLSSTTLGTATAAGSIPWIPAVTVSDTAGASLLASLNTNGTLVNKASNWDYFDGTSMATPHVSGVAALMMSVNASITNTSVESILASTAINLGPRSSYGKGIVNAQAAVSAAR